MANTVIWVLAICVSHSKILCRPLLQAFVAKRGRVTEVSPLKLSKLNIDSQVHATFVYWTNFILRELKGKLQCLLNIG